MWLSVKWPLPNVWLGTSVEHQSAAEDRIPHLMKCPAVKRFVSCEPLLGAIDLTCLTTGPAANVYGDAKVYPYGDALKKPPPPWPRVMVS